MKIALALILTVLFASFTLAQDFSVEKDFAKGKAGFKLEKFSEGEDATSGFDFLIYTDKSKVIKIRSIWNGGAGSQPRVEDYYYKNGALVMFAGFPATGKQFKILVKGGEAALVAKEKLYVRNSKLTAWFEQGKAIPASDARWKDKEREVLERAQSELENYLSMKAEADKK